MWPLVLLAKPTPSAQEAQAEFSRTVSIDSRKALGWRELIDNDIDAALQAAQQNKNIAMPGELSPESAVLAIMQENEQRFPDHVNTGFRARMRSKLKNPQLLSKSAE
jgi:hypothetical protein